MIVGSSIHIELSRVYTKHGVKSGVLKRYLNIQLRNMVSGIPLSHEMEIIKALMWLEIFMAQNIPQKHLHVLAITLTDKAGETWYKK